MVIQQTCGDVLASLVSIRCSIIAACLVVILVALASLIGIDLIDCLSYSNQQYNIGSREAQLYPDQLGDDPDDRLGLARQQGTSSRLLDDCLLNPISSGMEQKNNLEIERKTPLLSTRTHVIQSNHRSPGDLDCGDESYDDCNEVVEDDDDIRGVNNTEITGNRNYSPTIQQKTTPILTKASYIYNRTQSPVFLDHSSLKVKAQSNNNSNSSLNQVEPKSVLKKSTSFQRVDDDDDGYDNNNEMEEYQKQMQREVQTRRSLLNVRFAE